jgi:hypothetical protein
MIEYLAKTLKKMKNGYGVGSKAGPGGFFFLAGGPGRWMFVILTTMLPLVENTQQRRDVQLFVKGRVLWKNPIYHQTEH